MFQGSFLKTALWALAAIFGVVGYKMLKVDNLEAVQRSYDVTLGVYGKRLSDYEDKLSDLRVESRVSKELLQRIETNTEKTNDEVKDQADA